DGESATSEGGRRPAETDPWILIARYAGVVGFDPGKLTLRELVAAHDSRQASEWDRTCELVATAINVAAKKHVLNGQKINPYRKREQFKPLTLGDMEAFL